MPYHGSLPYERDNRDKKHGSRYRHQSQRGTNYSCSPSRTHGRSRRSRSSCLRNYHRADDDSSTRTSSRRFRDTSTERSGFAHKRHRGRNFSARYSRDLSPSMTIDDNCPDNDSGFKGRENTHSGFYRSQSRDGFKKRRSRSPIRTPPRHSDNSCDINQRISIVGFGNNINKRLSSTDHSRDVNGRYSNMDSSYDINRRLSNTSHNDNINDRLSSASHESNSYNRSRNSIGMMEKQSRSFGDAQSQSKSPDDWRGMPIKNNRSSSSEQTVYQCEDESDRQLHGNDAVDEYGRARKNSDRNNRKIGHCGIQEQMSIHRHDTRPGEYRKDITVTPGSYMKRSVLAFIWDSKAITATSVFSYASTYGEIGNTFDTLGRNKCCFFTYYDSRAADKLFEETRGKINIQGVIIKLKLSRPYYDADYNHPLPRDFQATVLVSLEDASEGFNDSDSAYFERFGAVEGFYPYLGRPDEWIVNFFDTRAAQDAIMICHGKPFHGGTMYTTKIWGDVAVGSETACPLIYGSSSRDVIKTAPVEQPLPVTTSKNGNVDSRKSVEMPPLTTRIRNSGLKDAAASKPAYDPNFNVETKPQILQQRDLDVQPQSKPSLSVIGQPLSSDSATSVSANQRLQNELLQSQVASTSLKSLVQNMPLSAPTAESIESKLSPEPCTASGQISEQAFNAEPQSAPPAPSAAVSAPNAVPAAAPDEEYSEGISRLLGILAQVQKTSF